MIRKIIISSLLVLFAFGFAAFAQQRTKVNSQYAKRKLVGRHFVSLQWIGWDYLGRAYVRQKKGVLYLKGGQKDRDGEDFMILDGVITEINRYNFKFKGKVSTKVSHNNGGEVCIREGEMTFAITKKRRYWRLQEMKNPCGTITDYVDIYFRK